MKALILCLFTVAAIWAQGPPPAQGVPPAPPLPNLPDDTLIVTFDDGVKFTMADFKKVFAVLPPDTQQMALRDRQTFLHQWNLMRKLTQMADTAKLNESSPTKEALEYYRMFVMSQAKINDVVANMTVEPAEIVKYYDVNKEKYKMVRVKTIYLSFNNNPSSAPLPGGKKSLSEEEAKVKATKLAAELKAGADFVKAVKENSDDETSRAKDGDFPTLRPTDNIPDSLKAAVFALKTGEISAPIRQPNGFYIFRAEEVTYRPLSQARDEIFSQLKQEYYATWMDKTNRESKETYHSQEFLGAPLPSAPPKK